MMCENLETQGFDPSQSLLFKGRGGCSHRFGGVTEFLDPGILTMWLLNTSFGRSLSVRHRPSLSTCVMRGAVQRIMQTAHMRP